MYLPNCHMKLKFRDWHLTTPLGTHISTWTLELWCSLHVSMLTVNTSTIIFYSPCHLTVSTLSTMSSDILVSLCPQFQACQGGTFKRHRGRRTRRRNRRASRPCYVLPRQRSRWSSWYWLWTRMARHQSWTHRRWGETLMTSGIPPRSSCH